MTDLKNRLFYGDNLGVLRKHIASGSVDLAYIDPPFNSKRNYFQIYNNQGIEDRAQAQAFVDTWEWGDDAIAGFDWITHVDRLNGDPLNPHGAVLTRQTVALIKGLLEVLGKGSLFAYIVHMTQRIVEIHRALKPTGSFYLHCDPTASHYLKLVCDAVFCGQGGDFRNEIIWKRKAGRGETNNEAIRFGVSHDIILFYSKSRTTTLSRQHRANSQDYLDSKFTHYDADGRRYRLDNLTSPSFRPNLTYEYKGYSSPAKGWAVSRETMERMDAEGRVHFPADKTKRLQRKRFFDELAGETVDSLWDDIPPINSQAAERLGYPTQKPEALLERIIRASSNEGDVVLDAYCGCGTTVAVAQRLKRKWIGIDITYQSIALILKRLEDRYPAEWSAIEADIVLDGIPKDINSARALANKKDDRTRKEFEKWAILTYSRNQARINEKKGADAGIDGIAYFLIDRETNGKAIFQVKSGGANRATLATLNSDRQREEAEFGILISMDPATKSMRDEIAAAGTYKHPLLNREDDRIQVVTIEEILDGKRLDLPMARGDAVKSAAAISAADDQISLL